MDFVLSTFAFVYLICILATVVFDHSTEMSSEATTDGASRKRLREAEKKQSTTIAEAIEQVVETLGVDHELFIRSFDSLPENKLSSKVPTPEELASIAAEFAHRLCGAMGVSDSRFVGELHFVGSASDAESSDSGTDTSSSCSSSSSSSSR